jgi:hypothetical protein
MFPQWTKAMPRRAAEAAPALAAPRKGKDALMRNLFALLAALLLGAGVVGCNHFDNWHSTGNGAAPGCNCAAGGSMQVVQPASTSGEPPLLR